MYTIKAHHPSRGRYNHVGNAELKITACSAAKRLSAKQNNRVIVQTGGKTVYAYRNGERE